MHTLGAAILIAATFCAGETRTEHFDIDPGWDGHNNRMVDEPGRETVQRMGFSATNHAGGASGEVGGTIQMAAERAYYAMALANPLSLNDRISASGTLAFAEGRATGPVLIGFFNHENSYGWRSRNSLAIRIDGRGEVLHAHIEYCTDRYRAGAGAIAAMDPETERFTMDEFPASGPHTWSFDYDPAGTATFTFDGRTATMAIAADHRQDGAVFDRFGLFNVMKSSDNRAEVYIDNVVINGVSENFDADPQWESDGNPHEYRARIVRPWFDFGFSLTKFSGGYPGEMGGVVFRGDHRFEHTKAFYGDRTDDLSLAKPLRAEGRVSLVRGVSDSGTLIGWFHAERSLQGGTDKSTIPQNFLGVFIEGPSREGFLFRPAYRIHGEEAGVADGPHILPDASTHLWTLDYQPGLPASITVSLDGKSTTLTVPDEHFALGASFNRFGIITTQIDGNMEIIYFDDLTYTVKQ